MKAIIINPSASTITGTNIEYTGSLKPFYDLIGCDLVEIVRLGSIDGVEQVAVIDEEGMLKGEQAFVRLGDLPLAGTIVLLSEVETAEGADFTDTKLDARGVLRLFMSGQFDWITPRAALESIAEQQQIQAERLRQAGWDVEMTGEFGFIATKGE